MAGDAVPVFGTMPMPVVVVLSEKFPLMGLVALPRLPWFTAPVLREKFPLMGLVGPP